MYKFLMTILVVITPICNGNPIQTESIQWIEKTFEIRKALAEITVYQDIKHKIKNEVPVTPLQKEMYTAIKVTKTKLNEIVRLSNNAYHLENLDAAKQLFHDAEIKLNEAYEKLKIAQLTTSELRARL